MGWRSADVSSQLSNDGVLTGQDLHLDVPIYSSYLVPLSKYNAHSKFGHMEFWKNV
jgi:hypothetical protein